MSRRARPTLRVLREDLGDGWPTPFTRRAIEAGDIEAIQPLDALDHPILLKASSSFTDNPADDTYVGSIASVSSSQLLEIKSGQWRAGVLVESDVCWVVTAGLAKAATRIAMTSTSPSSGRRRTARSVPSSPLRRIATR